MVFVMTLQGCATTTGQSGSPPVRTNGRTVPETGTAPDSSSGSRNISVGFGCVIGGVVGALAGKAVAAGSAKKDNLSKKEQAKRERSYQIAGALLGCGGGGILGGTVYAKLSEAGRKERENALAAAASQARPQRYGEPDNPALKGSVKPGKAYTEVAANRECMDVEDSLADGKSKDSMFVKMCRNLPNGGWAPVTA